MNIDEYLQSRRLLVDRTLDRYLPPPDTPPSEIHEAMRYAVLGGGKRIRPLIAIAAAEACGAEVEPLMRHFSALELIHTYSLVHDDLPALDDDDLRRGRKTTHVVFGEAMGILTGDALLTEAFVWLAQPLEVPLERQLRALREVALAIDSKGMIGGQVADLQATGLPAASADPALSPEEQLARLRFIHENKTGKLLTVSAVLGGTLAGADETRLEALRTYGRSVGLAFQIVDDLLDQEESAATLGKTAGKDAAQGKLTYPAVVGAERAREEAARLLEVALENADMIAGPVNYLGELARYVCARRS
ncbi:MAG TPA: farnesyl diphosphate synthase [Thermoanaerobaculia bacterium]|nr:farnesyl diphosphate synthase [Thermoanaerobaculia bacterium]